MRILTENLSQHQNVDAVIQKLETAITGYSLPETSGQALAAIAEFVNESYIESALPGTLESVIERLSVYKGRSLSSQSATKNSSKEQPLTDQASSDQAINAISSYVEQQEVLGSTIAQDLATLADQLRSRSVAASDQQLTSVLTEHLESTNYGQTTQRAISAMAGFIEARTIEATPVEQNLEVLLNQLLQPSSQEVTETGQKSLLPPVERQPKVVKTKAIEIQTSQLLEALADYVAVEAIDAALAELLGSLVKELTQHQQGVSKQQINKHCEDAIAQYSSSRLNEIE